MRRIIYTLTLFCVITTFGQTTISFKTKNNETIDFEISKKNIYIGNTDNTAKLNQEKIVAREKDFTIIETTEKEYDDKVKKIKTENAIVEPVLIYKDGAKQIW